MKSTAGPIQSECLPAKRKAQDCLRIVPYQIKTLDDLHLPPVLASISLEQRGLILVTGTTGSGKSTTLASMIDIINTERNCHIITVRTPSNLFMEDKKAIIDQREIGSDTSTFSSALRVALRQDPDVILVGEMRDFRDDRDSPDRCRDRAIWSCPHFIH